MSTALITHNDCLRHETPQGHPERIARLETILDLLESSKYDALIRVDAPLCAIDHLTRCHPQPYIDKIRNSVPKRGYFGIDSDTHLSVGSWEAVLRAAGGCIEAIDIVIGGKAKNAFCAMRPPGHHAEMSRAMGFCFFGNIALAAKYAMHEYGIEKIAIVDFDVHHGNGTSDLIWNEENVLFASTHEMPLYPGTGYPSEKGKYNQIINKPLAPKSGGKEFKKVLNEILERIDAHKPELLLISAGFDAHYRDPLSTLKFEEEDYAWATKVLCDIAAIHSDGRVVSTLEGGYDLKGLAGSIAAHIEVLMEQGE